MYRIAFFLLTLSVWLAFDAPNTFAQSDSDAVGGDEFRVNGLVIDRRKYSFTLQTLDRNYTVTIPNGTPLLMKLTKPEFDLDQRTISVSLMQSSKDGRPENDTVLTWPLADPVWVSITFRDEQEKAEVMQEHVKHLDRFEISPFPFERTPLTFGGQLLKSQTTDQFFLDDSGGVYSVELGTRRGLLGGFTINDLKPLQTSVWVQGRFDGETVVASRIRFEYLGDPVAGFDASLPNLLSLGDVTSYDYQRPLIEALQGKVNFHHPPTWTGPSRNWDRLHHYTGVLDSAEPTWDVIAFNYGIRDDRESREAYQENLRQVVRVLRRTGAKLVWVNSAPIPSGYPAGDPNRPLEGRVPGRMQLQNQWAADVMKEYPDIVICDIWSVVKQGQDELYERWWQQKNINFDYAQSIPLGRTVARSVLNALGTGQELNAMNVHADGDAISSSR